MKRITFASILAILVVCSAAIAPGKTKEKDIIGKWKFHLEIGKAIEEETQDEDDFGSLFARGIGRLVDDLVDEVDITFDFQKNNILVVTQDSSFDDDDEEPNVETYRWKINKKGYVVTTPINKRNKSFQDSDGWKLKKGKLVPVDEDDEEIVWMERIND